MSEQHSKRTILKEVEKAVNKDFNMVGDDSDVNLSDYSWDDLNSLKTELGNAILEFIQQVNSVISNREVIATLGSKLPYFEKLVTTFFSDINEFSSKIAKIRVKHEDMSGPILSIDEYDLYNRLSIGYHSLYVELTTLVPPTLSEIILTIHDAVSSLQVEQTKKATEEITDITEVVDDKRE